ncbi:hypothetical protein [Maricaulis sp.]|uniref:hypothetical protein n=1 Tax=Maricaulis sp. TaxID=1486257 RepID=UPI002613E26E|nr:hypothetical protein [Maricaulis sp.]
MPIRFAFAAIASLALQLAATDAAEASDCDRFAQHRDSYLYRASAGMGQALEQLAAQRQVPREAAAFYWGGDLMRSSDPSSPRSLALLTLATYDWAGHESRAEAAMADIFHNRGNAFAGLLVGLMLSDQRGAPDAYRARAYLRDASRAGNDEARAFLGLFDACHGRAIAFN